MITFLPTLLIVYQSILPLNACIAHIQLPTPCHHIAKIEEDPNTRDTLNVHIISPPSHQMCIQVVKPIKLPVSCSIRKINLYLDDQFWTDKVIIYPRRNDVF